MAEFDSAVISGIIIDQIDLMIKNSNKNLANLLISLKKKNKEAFNKFDKKMSG